MTKSSWLLPPTNLILSTEEVHVWRARLDLPVSQVKQLKQTLSADEVDRAERFYFQQDSRHFIVARGLLRTILSRYLNVAPHQLRFNYGEHGKPTLAASSDQPKLNFNLSHAGGLVLYAVTYGRAVGIDLERIRFDFEYEQLAARFFSAQENAVLRDLPAHLKPEAFFNCWTRKEAYIKAKGQGLALPLNQFDVSLVPGEPAKLLSARGDAQEASRWALQELIPDPGYVAALAVEGDEWQLACWRWPN